MCLIDLLQIFGHVNDTVKDAPIPFSAHCTDPLSQITGSSRKMCFQKCVCKHTLVQHDGCGMPLAAVYCQNVSLVKANDRS